VKIVTNGIWDWWSEEGELELELLTVAMASGRRRRTEGCSVAQVGEEGVTGGFEMASSCFQLRWRAAAWLHARER
jgi:hypothetical protein